MPRKRLASTVLRFDEPIKPLDLDAMKEPKPMQEIHQIQEKIYEEDKNLSRKERIDKTNRIAEEMIRRHGLKLRLHGKDKAA